MLSAPVLHITINKDEKLSSGMKAAFGVLSGYFILKTKKSRLIELGWLRCFI
jgi:hypothetical protein